MDKFLAWMFITFCALGFVYGAVTEFRRGRDERKRRRKRRSQQVPEALYL